MSARNTRGRVRLHGLFGLAIVVGWLLGSSPVQAGDRDPEAVFVRMDDGSDPDSKACYRAIRAPLAKGAAVAKSMSREKLMTAIGAESLEGFEGWPRDRFAGAFGQTVDGLILIDCRPGDRVVNVVVFAGTSDDIAAEGKLIRVQIEGVEIDRSVRESVGERVRTWVWNMMSY